jgi:hypothetical protein
VTAREAWTLRLHEAAPDCDWALLRVLAGLLASRATADVLFLVFDALLEAAREARACGYNRPDGFLRALAILIADEAARRAPARTTPG